jgi:hypothetical protein
MFERTKTVHALDSTATVIGGKFLPHFKNIFHCMSKLSQDGFYLVTKIEFLLYY